MKQHQQTRLSNARLFQRAGTMPGFQFLTGIGKKLQRASFERQVEAQLPSLVRVARGLISHRELDYQDSRPAEIRKWFSDKVNFRVPLPVKTVDLQLAGGRLCNMFDQRIASFMYEVDDVWVSLYIMRSKPDRATIVEQELLLQGYGYIEWENQGLHYPLVGDVSVERLRQLAVSLYSKQLLANLPGSRLATMPSSKLQINPNWGLQNKNA
jgi:anti-sigma factor RsiW